MAYGRNSKLKCLLGIESTAHFFPATGRGFVMCLGHYLGYDGSATKTGIHRVVRF